MINENLFSCQQDGFNVINIIDVIRFVFILYVGLIANSIFSQDIEYSSIQYLQNTWVDDLSGLSDKYGNLCIYYASNGKSYFVIYNNQGKIVNTLKFDFSEIGKIHSIIDKNEYFCIYYKPSFTKNNTLYLLKINKVDGLYEKHEIEIEIKNNEKLMSIIGNRDNLYLISSVNNSEQLFLKVFDGSGSYENHEIKISIPDYCKGILKNQYVFYHDAIEYTLYNGHFYNKIFLDSTHIYMITDNFVRIKNKESVTAITQIDLKNYTGSINCLIPDTNYNKEKSNSYICNNSIYKIRTSPDVFILSIFDKITLSQEKDIVLSLQDKFYLLDGSIYRQQKNGKIKNRDKKYKTTKDLYATLNYGTPVILAKKISDNSVKLLIGSYKVERSAFEYGMLAGHTVLLFYSLALSVDLYNFPEEDPKGISTFFETSLSYPNHEKISKADTPINDIKEFITIVEKSGIKTNQRTVICHPNGKYIVYVNKNNKSIDIKKLDIKR